MKLGLYILGVAMTVGCATDSPAITTTPPGPTEAPSSEHVTKLRVVEDRLFLLGGFDSDTYEQVHDVLEQDPAINTLVFTVNPGSDDDDNTLRLGRYIRERGLHTMVTADGVIASGGVSLFLSGKTRTVEQGAHVGVHSWTHCWSDTEDGPMQCKQAIDHPKDDPGHRLHGDYILEMLGSRDFYWFSISAAPAKQIHWMTPEELEEYGVSAMASTQTPHPFGTGVEEAKLHVRGLE